MKDVVDDDIVGVEENLKGIILNESNVDDS